MHRIPFLPLLLTIVLAATAATAFAAGTPMRRVPHAAAATSGKRTPSPRAPVAKAARDSARTLEAIHIEGELDVPEVLFITARDQRRIVEFQHRRYLQTSTDMLRDAAPTRIVVARGAARAVAPPPATPPSATGDPR